MAQNDFIIEYEADELYQRDSKCLKSNYECRHSTAQDWPRKPSVSAKLQDEV